MPDVNIAVDVFCTPEVRVHLRFPEMRDSIKQSVRRLGSVELTVRDQPLTGSAFSFKFHHPEDGDELANDIIVRIRLNPLEGRVVKVSDAMSRAFATYIADDLAKFFQSRAIAVRVELMLAEVRWGTASTAD